jgi:MFS transporter, PAT family, beta-lactamase induction signal transducer AmpG
MFRQRLCRGVLAGQVGKKLAAFAPALDHRWTVSTPPATKSKKDLLWTSTTYFGEGLPWSFLHQMGAEFLTAIGASNAQVGMTSALHGAVTLKFLWSPIVDLFGRKRTWLWVMQIILGIAMLVVAAIAPTGNLTAFWAALSVLSILHATHDIACDGFYLQALDRKGQALFAGTRIAAFRVATLVGASALVWVAAQTSWMIGFGAAGVLMLATAGTNRLVMPQPPEHHPQETPDGAAHKRPTAFAFLEAYKTFFTQPKAVLVLAFLLLYRVGDIMMFGQSKPLLRDLGVTTGQRGILNGFSITFTILGSIVGGAIIARKGLARCLVPMAYLQNLAIPLYIAMAVFKPTLPGIVAIVLTEQFVAGVGAVAFSVFQMQRTRKAFSAAHFAFITAVVSAASMVPGMISGFLSQRYGFPWFFTIAFLASLPSLALVHFVPKQPIEADTES